jgi:hypothetical protein
MAAEGISGAAIDMGPMGNNAAMEHDRYQRNDMSSGLFITPH